MGWNVLVTVIDCVVVLVVTVLGMTTVVRVVETVVVETGAGANPETTPTSVILSVGTPQCMPQRLVIVSHVQALQAEWRKHASQHLPTWVAGVSTVAQEPSTKYVTLVSLMPHAAKLEATSVERTADVADMAVVDVGSAAFGAAGAEAPLANDRAALGAVDKPDVVSIIVSFS